MPTKKAPRDDPKAPPHHGTVLALTLDGQEARDSTDAVDDIVWKSKTTDILDWLWECGDSVTAIAIPRQSFESLEVYHLVDVVERDWPGVKIIWYKTCPVERGDQPGSASL